MVHARDAAGWEGACLAAPRSGAAHAAVARGLPAVTGAGDAGTLRALLLEGTDFVTGGAESAGSGGGAAAVRVRAWEEARVFALHYMGDRGNFLSSECVARTHAPLVLSFVRIFEFAPYFVLFFVFCILARAPDQHK